MNRLDTVFFSSTPDGPAQRVITVDGVPLDAILAQSPAGQALLGLVPALADGLAPREGALVRRRMLPPPGQRAVAPVLVCPDDLDLWCTVAVAEVAAEDGFIRWLRLGLDTGRPHPGDMPEAIGGTVDWFEGIGPFCFERAEYLKCLASFDGKD